MNQTKIDMSMLQAVAHHRAGRFAEASAIYRKILTINPNFAPALQFLGLIRGQLGQTTEAIELISRAIALSPSADGYTNLAYFLAAAGKTPQAIDASQKAIAINPDAAQAHCNLGNALKAAGRFTEAITSLDRAVQLDPRNAMFQSNLGSAFAAAKQFDQAVVALRRAIELQPTLAEAHNNLANVLKKTGKYADALLIIRRALELNPNLAEAHSNLGSIQMELGEIDSAIASYRHAIALKADLNDAHWNLAHPLLLKGEFREGWQKYHFRWTIREQIMPREFSQPGWIGQPLNGQTILLHAEQGMGDTIQFARFAPMVRARGGNVILECQPELRRLLANSYRNIRVITAGDTIGDFDLQCPLLDLPEIFNIEQNSIPAPIPYLKADPADVERFAPRIPRTGRKRIGLIRAGRAEHRNDHNRSIPVELLRRLGEVADVDWYTWQRPPNSELSAQLKMIDLSPEVRDFCDTAAALAHLDLLITVDTSSAHLAGALGRPVWLLLPFLPDWRWMLDRADSPWYPSVRLFRQPVLNDWRSVMQSVAHEL